VFQPLAGRATPQPVTCPDVHWNASRLPAEYELTGGGAGYDRSAVDAANDNLIKWVQSDYTIDVANTSGVVGLYWEVDITGATEIAGYHGAATEAWAAVATNYDGGTTPPDGDAVAYGGDGTVRAGGIEVASSLPTYGDGDTLMFALDPVDGSFWFGVNGAWDGQPWTTEPRASIPSSSSYVATGHARGAGDAGVLKAKPADLTYPVPAGFAALGDPRPGPVTRPVYWVQPLGTPEWQYTLDTPRGRTATKGTSGTGVATFAMSSTIMGGGAEPADFPAAGYYWELDVPGSGAAVGLVQESNWTEMATPVDLQWRNNGWIYNGSILASQYETFGAGRVMFCFNPFTNALWLGSNGTWFSDPSAPGSNAVVSGATTRRWRVMSASPVTTIFGDRQTFAYPVPANATPLGQKLYV